MATKSNPADAGKARIMFNGTAKLKKALSFVGAAVSSNPVFPVLENVKCQAKDGLVTLTSYNLQITLSATVPADLFGADGATFLLPFVLTSKVIGSLPGQEVFLTLGENNTATISEKKGTYKLAGEDPADFPTSKGMGTTLHSFTLAALDRMAFCTALSDAAYGCSTDDLRPAMTGVNLQSVGNSLVVAASDGHLLKRSGITVKGDLPAINIILPKRFAMILGRLSQDADQDLEMDVRISSGSFSAQVGNFNAECRLIDERFPDYQNAIPVGNDKEAKMDREVLAILLKRMMPFTNQITNQIALHFSAGSLAISAEDTDMGNEGNDGMDIDFVGDAITIGFNGKVLAEAVQRITTNTIRMELSAPNRAGLMYSHDQDLTLLMPQLLNSL